MKVIKYILLIALLFTLWTTRPLWMPEKPHTDTTPSPIDIQIKQQQTQRNELFEGNNKKIKDIEEKFGKKPTGKYSTGVPLAVQSYWDKTLKYPNSLEEERCGPIRVGSNGWVTVCRYRIKNSSGAMELIQNTYIIKNETVIK